MSDVLMLSAIAARAPWVVRHTQWTCTLVECNQKGRTVCRHSWCHVGTVDTRTQSVQCAPSVGTVSRHSPWMWVWRLGPSTLTSGVGQGSCFWPPLAKALALWPLAFAKALAPGLERWPRLWLLASSVGQGSGFLASSFGQGSGFWPPMLPRLRLLTSSFGQGFGF